MMRRELRRHRKEIRVEMEEEGSNDSTPGLDDKSSSGSVSSRERLRGKDRG